MTDGSHGESLLSLAAAGVDVDDAAQQLLESGTDVEALSEVAEFLHALNADPSTRDRALLLVERTRLLAERGAAAAQQSDELRAYAARMRTESRRLRLPAACCSMSWRPPSRWRRRPWSCWRLVAIPR